MFSHTLVWRKTKEEIIRVKRGVHFSSALLYNEDEVVKSGGLIFNTNIGDLLII